MTRPPECYTLSRACPAHGPARASPAPFCGRKGMAARLHLAITAVALSAGVSLPSGPRLADDSKEQLQKILPVEVYRELARREVDLLQELLKDAPGEQALRRARVGAVLVA